jgi:prepilin-type N-terminal cleavage/methylation domain-containing protein
MIRHIRDIQARRRGEELAEKGFTLIELLIVIVVLGILAATVVFALTGVTGQSAQAACNSDAKTVETAVQAFIDSPTNATNAPPAAGAAGMQSLVTGGYIHALPTNQAYAISLDANGNVLVTPTGKAQGTYDSSATGATNPCNGVS